MTERDFAVYIHGKILASGVATTEEVPDKLFSQISLVVPSYDLNDQATTSILDSTVDSIVQSLNTNNLKYNGIENVTFKVRNEIKEVVITIITEGVVTR
jgi:hypothetical protein